MNRKDNQQDYILDDEQTQVILTATFGDGCIPKGKSYYKTNSIYRGYMFYKKNFLKDLCINEPRHSINRGYKKGSLFHIHTKYKECIRELHSLSIQEKLNKLTPLGIALWFYDDGSLHKNNHFYNLNTHAFTEEEHKKYLLPFFENLGWNLKPRIAYDRKKDGRVFCYLYFPKHEGAFEIAKLLREYYVPEFEYKMWSSETIQKWSKLRAELKSQDRTVSRRMFSNMIKEMEL